MLSMTWSRFREIYDNGIGVTIDLLNPFFYGDLYVVKHLMTGSTQSFLEHDPIFQSNSSFRKISFVLILPNTNLIYFGAQGL